MSKITKEFVDSIELDCESWQFYELGVWRDESGFYLSTDSGCSCPTPWESHNDDSLTGPLTFEQVAEEAKSLWGDGRRSKNGESDVAINEFLEGLK